MQSIQKLFVVIFVALLTGCSTDSAEKPAVTPLATSQAELHQLYGINRGELGVKQFSGEFTMPDERTVPLQIFLPTQGDNFPLLVFSHGNWSDNTKYNNVIEHWVSHGYVVVAPYHLDGGGMARGIFNSMRYGQLGLIESRANELQQLMNQLPALEQEYPELAGKIDYNKIAATGHSFGGYSAQQMIGASAYDPDAEQHKFFSDDRVQAVVAISPPGKMFDVIVDDSWRQVSKPMLVTTGTWDSNPQFWPDWRDHLISYDTAQAGNNYGLVIQGADHYLGNLICRPEREEPPQHDALKMVNAASITFLDAYLKNIPAAQAALANNQLTAVTASFAEVTQR